MDKGEKTDLNYTQEPDNSSSAKEGSGDGDGSGNTYSLSGPLYPKLSMCFEGTWLTQLVQLVTASRLFLGHKGQVNL